MARDGETRPRVEPKFAMNETLTTPTEFKRLRAANPGATWAVHKFRALFEPDELAEYERIVAGEYGTNRSYRLFYDNDAAEPETPAAAPPSEPLLPLCSRFAVACLYKMMYYSIAPLPLARPRKRAPGEPIRVLRIASAIAQGGVAKVCLQTLLRMPEGEVHVGVLVFDEKDPVLPEVQRRPNIELLCRKLMLFPKIQNLKMIRAVHKALKMARRFRPDIIHLHEPQLAPVARMMGAWTGAAVCVHLHNDYNERQQSIPARLLGVTRHALRRSRLIACSQTIHDAGEAWLGDMAHPIELIEDGSDDIKQPSSNEDRLGERLVRAAAGRQVVAMMTHLVPHKRIGDFLSACRILLDEGRPIYVLLMAYSAKRKFGRAMCRYFNKQFAPHEGEFLFCVPDAPRLLPHVDVGVSTSVLEGLGLNVLEFQVDAVPVVCTDIKPHREMVEEGVSGLLFPPQDVPACARRIRELLDDGELARRIGEGGRAAAARRNWQKTADHTVAFYKQLLAARSS